MTVTYMTNYYVGCSLACLETSTVTPQRSSTFSVAVSTMCLPFSPGTHSLEVVLEH